MTNATSSCGSSSTRPRSQRAPALAALRGAIRRARRAHADEVCKKISTEKLFGLTNWYKGKRRAPLPPIQSGDTLVTEPQQKAQAFANKFFPKSSMPTISLDPIGVPLHPERPHQPISDQEITNALKDTSNMSAPGAFGTNYRLLKWAYAANPDPIETLYNGCLDLGYHPSALRNAVISIIPKPRKTNMSDPKSYRPISLLETLSKLLEKIITRRLIFEAGKHDLLPHTQFGGRDMTSCTDAGICLVNDIHAYWNQKEYVSLLTMDVSGYFNNIDHVRLIYMCKRLGYSSNICNWLHSYLNNRTAQPRVDDVMCSPIAPPIGWRSPRFSVISHFVFHLLYPAPPMPSGQPPHYLHICG
ncbi:hypothetical protein OPQ81_005380 [Rhizoctonia solani]|nr:hypothetical protein OPQ81_005380 [Rhizoctonia solani]